MLAQLISLSMCLAGSFSIQMPLRFTYVIYKQYIAGFYIFLQSIIFEIVTNLFGIHYYYFVLYVFFFLSAYLLLITPHYITFFSLTFSILHWFP